VIAAVLAVTIAASLRADRRDHARRHPDIDDELQADDDALRGRPPSPSRLAPTARLTQED
jgi:hypothetical protein